MAKRISRDPCAYNARGSKNLPSPGMTEIFRSNWKDEDHKRKVLSCFVQAVYLLELDRQGNRTPETALAPKWLEPSKYKLSQTLIDERDGSIFGAVLEWAGYGVSRPSGAPQAILALRGTLLNGTTMRRDLTDDIRLFVRENLKGSVRFNATMDALKLSVDKFGDCNVCIAGHSLGAGFAIQVGKALAKNKVFIETHLFNLPSLSLLGCVWNSLFSSDDLRVRNNLPIVSLGEKVGNVWNNLNFILRGENRTDGEVWATIMKWGLYFYVNKSDFLCCQADTEVIENGPSSNSPAAKLFVNSKERQTPSDAHGIEQWWEDGLLLKALPNSKLIDRHLKSLMS